MKSGKSKGCYKAGGLVKGAGNHSGQKGAGASHGHNELKTGGLGHKPMASGSKHGHKAI